MRSIKASTDFNKVPSDRWSFLAWLSVPAGIIALVVLYDLWPNIVQVVQAQNAKHISAVGKKWTTAEVELEKRGLRVIDNYEGCRRIYTQGSRKSFSIWLIARVLYRLNPTGKNAERILDVTGNPPIGFVFVTSGTIVSYRAG